MTEPIKKAIPIIKNIELKYANLGYCHIDLHDKEDVSICLLESIVKTIRVIISEHFNAPSIADAKDRDLIASSMVFTPQNFLEMLTDECFIISDDAQKQIDNIINHNHILNDNGNPLRSYDFENIRRAIIDDASVVLVDVSGFSGDSDKYITKYRWYEVPYKAVADKLSPTDN